MKTKLLTLTICITALLLVNLAYGRYPISPYAYCANNPIKFIDPDGRDWYLHQETGVLYYNKELTSNTTTYNDQTYVRVGDNTMLGDMKDIAEQSYNFGDSRDLANNHGYNINPVQEVIQEENRTYSDHNSPAKATSTMLTVVNEKYSIFPNDAKNKATEKAEYLGNHVNFSDFLMAIGGTAKSETHSRRYSTYTENSNQPENRNEPGTVVITYKNWNDYSVATNGKGRLLKYKQRK